MRFHILGLQHTVISPEWSACAFTMKVLKFIEMMSGRGHELIVYGHKDSKILDAPDVEFVSVTNNDILRKAYGPEYVDEKQWKQQPFSKWFDIRDSAYSTFNANAIKEIQARKKPNDFLLCFWGHGHKDIADQCRDLIVVEPGIGYMMTFARFRIFESYAVMHAMLGAGNIQNCNQDWYDVVIPNYFREEDFTYCTKKDDYILHLGRVGIGKGSNVAVEACQKAGVKLIIAGQGNLKEIGYALPPNNVIEVGYADVEMRRLLLSKARALFIASMYIEPFAGVCVEALLSGTPLITTDWGVFPEYTFNGVTGYRCRNLREFAIACKEVQTIDPIECRKVGERYLYKSVAPQYERYFQSVLDIYTGNGWYQD